MLMKYWFGTRGKKPKNMHGTNEYPSTLMVVINVLIKYCKYVKNVNRCQITTAIQKIKIN